MAKEIMAICDTDEAKGLGCAKEYFKEHEEVKGIIYSVKTGCSDQSKSEVTLNRFQFLLSLYQEQPHLLDPHLENLLQTLLTIIRTSESEIQHQAFRFLYVVTKVRGHKVIVRYMPHEVNDLQFIMELLSKQDPVNQTIWETKYMLLIWLSIVVKIPFHMSRMDAAIEGQTAAKPMMERIMDIIRLYLGVPDTSANAAVILAGRFLTRPDATSSQLDEFIKWIFQTLSVTPPLAQQHHLLIATLAKLFKHGKREDLIPFAPTVLKYASEKKFLRDAQSLGHKMTMKLVQRIGLTFLKVRVAPWRYSRGTRSLAVNLATPASITAESKMELEDDNVDYDVPAELEDIIEMLLTGLRDEYFQVRWSAAKGIGRVTGRLPMDLANDVVSSILELFVPREAERSWHGGCLALAELGRRGLLLPQHLCQVIPVVKKALIFDENKGNFSIGSYIRDAASYVCWSFARAYDLAVLQPYVQDIAESLLITAVFDRQLPCRRAASAAFQENVGRIGTFPNGIEIVTTVDYSAVSLMSHTFLNLSVIVAGFKEYTIPLIEHLLLYKINHWDIMVRRLASQALRNLTPIAPQYMQQRVVPGLLPHITSVDYDARHGAVLSLAEVMTALGEQYGDNIRKIFDKDVLDVISKIISLMHNKKSFRGIGAELMREAACILIEHLSGVSFLPMDDWQNLDVWKEFVLDCLQYSEDSVRTEAARALAQFCNSYLSQDTEKQMSLLNFCISKLSASQQDTRQGYASAIGAFPKFMLENSVPLVLGKLIECATITKVEEQLWIKSRSSASRSLVRVMTTVGVDHVALEEFNDVFHCLLKGAVEYVRDVNGDTGNVVRRAALESLKVLMVFLVENKVEVLKQEFVEKAFCSLLRQCVEIVEKTRISAMQLVYQLIWSNPEIPNIPHRNELQEILPPEVCDNLAWHIPSETFPIYVKILDLPTYTCSILLGITNAIGSKSESLIKDSQSALQSYFLTRKLELSFLCDCFLKIFREYMGDDHFTIPFLITTDFLLSCGALEDSEDEFLQEIFATSVKFAALSRNVHRVMPLTGILSGLLQFDVCKSQALTYLVKLLYHQYPKVRKEAAQKLYEAVIGGTQIVDTEEHVDEVLTLLGETNWASMKREDVKSSLQALKRMLQA